MGRAADASTEGTAASFVCGAFTTISLRIHAETSTLEDARYLTNGCGFMTAAADVVCATITGHPLADLQGLHEVALDKLVADALGKLPPDRVQCASVVFEAMRSAFAKYRQSRIDEFQGEKALICTCFGVSEETIVETIAKNSLDEVSEVTRLCRAGSGCGSCRMLIEELIDARD